MPLIKGGFQLKGGPVYLGMDEGGQMKKGEEAF